MSHGAQIGLVRFSVGQLSAEDLRTHLGNWTNQRKHQLQPYAMFNV